MKASEIVDKLKSVLLSAEEPQLEEQVDLSVDEIKVEDAVELEDMPLNEDAPSDEEGPKEMEYVTKQEFDSAISEMKAMYSAIVEKMSSEEESVDVPEELSVEEKVDLSSEEPAAAPISHSPEVEETKKPVFFSGAKPRNTMSIVYEKMFNK